MQRERQKSSHAITITEECSTRKKKKPLSFFAASFSFLPLETPFDVRPVLSAQICNSQQLAQLNGAS